MLNVDLLLLTGARVRDCIHSVASLDWSHLRISAARSGSCACYQRLLLSDIWWQRQLGSHHRSDSQRSTEALWLLYNSWLLEVILSYSINFVKFIFENYYSVIAYVMLLEFRWYDIAIHALPYKNVYNLSYSDCRMSIKTFTVKFQVKYVEVMHLLLILSYL